MHKPQVMCIGQACAKLLDNFKCFIKRQTALFLDMLLDVVLELHALHEFHGDVHGSARATDAVKVIDGRDVRVSQFLLA